MMNEERSYISYDLYKNGHWFCSIVDNKELAEHYARVFGYEDFVEIRAEKQTLGGYE